MRTIGIIGKAGSGKSTVANHLVANHGFAVGQFAHKLKDIVCEVYGWDRARIEDLDYKEEVPWLTDGPQCPGPTGSGMTRRQVLQHVGTEGFRYCAQDTWIRYEMNALCGGPSLIVFPDVRFGNEAGAIRAMGGQIWKTVKIGGDQTGSADHRSETEMDTIQADHVLECAAGHVGCLLEKVERLLR
jgi:RecA/RadA recombinase